MLEVICGVKRRRIRGHILGISLLVRRGVAWGLGVVRFFIFEGEEEILVSGEGNARIVANENIGNTN